MAVDSVRSSQLFTHFPVTVCEKCIPVHPSLPAKPSSVLQSSAASLQCLWPLGSKRSIKISCFCRDFDNMSRCICSILMFVLCANPLTSMLKAVAFVLLCTFMPLFSVLLQQMNTKVFSWILFYFAFSCKCLWNKLHKLWNKLCKLLQLPHQSSSRYLSNSLSVLATLFGHQYFTPVYSCCHSPLHWKINRSVLQVQFFRSKQLLLPSTHAE